jgi:hypothetical protein
MCGWFNAARTRASRSKTRKSDRILRNGVWQHLYGDDTRQPCVGRAIHFAHPANGEQRLDARRAELRTGREASCVGR